RYVKPLLERIEQGDIDPSAVITHRGTLDDAPDLYKMFRAKRDHCEKVVLHPQPAARPRRTVGREPALARR
ncbi:MAG: hypothetical protein JO102_06260, partial [Elusimicrobia bacterium]|nr:hypothetical protein [Elusimicrobiota bacterium]